MYQQSRLAGLPEAIRSWKVGDDIPEALFSVRYSPPPGLRGCMPIIGLSGEDYARNIDSSELLKTILAHPRADDRLFQVALWRVLTTRQLSDSARLTSELIAQRPQIIQQGWLAEVVSALRSPCIRLEIARFDKDRPVPLDEARRVIAAMRHDLLAGKGWKDSYRVASDQMLNQDDIRSESKHVGTQLSYAFSGSATPEYRDFIGRRDLRTDRHASVPSDHLEVLFAAVGGTHIIETDAAIWLYQVEEYFSGTGDSAQPGRYT